MMFPVKKPLFEDVSSKEYYARVRELKKKAFNGCVHIVFPDFEEAILFYEGNAVAAMHQFERWMTIGDGLVELAENKAIAVGGKMAAYELSEGLLDIFVHRSLKNMVETELGPYTVVSRLIGYLEGDKSTCILKLEEGNSTGYVFINDGKREGAVFGSQDGRLYDDEALKAMERYKEHARVAIYFTGPSAKYSKLKAETSTVTPAVVEPLAPGSPQAPLATIKLVVATSSDPRIGMRHRSRQQTLEALEEGDVAWVDGNTFSALQPDASIVLPDGRNYQIRLKATNITARDGCYIILPKKFKKKISVANDAIIEIKA